MSWEEMLSPYDPKFLLPKPHFRPFLWRDALVDVTVARNIDAGTTADRQWITTYPEGKGRLVCVDFFEALDKSDDTKALAVWEALELPLDGNFASCNLPLIAGTEDLDFSRNHHYDRSYLAVIKPHANLLSKACPDILQLDAQARRTYHQKLPQDLRQFERLVGELNVLFDAGIAKFGDLTLTIRCWNALRDPTSRLYKNLFGDADADNRHARWARGMVPSV